jgi:hypothetical protein
MIAETTAEAAVTTTLDVLIPHVDAHDVMMKTTITDHTTVMTAVNEDTTTNLTADATRTPTAMTPATTTMKTTGTINLPPGFPPISSIEDNRYANNSFLTASPRKQKWLTIDPSSTTSRIVD